MYISSINKKFYTLSLSLAKSRIYLTVWGQWNMSVMEEFEGDIKSLIDQAPTPFTVLSDIRFLQPHALVLQRINEEIQKYAMKNGLLESANVSSNNDIVELQNNRAASNSGMSMKLFSTIEEAEDYLNSLSVS